MPRVPMAVRALLILLSTSGCGTGLDEALHTYQAEVLRALGAREGPEAYAPRTLSPPRRRERRIEIAEGERLGVLDFLSLQGCRLGELAGFRNSPMGRVMTDTRRLIYELEVEEAAHACLATLEEPRRTRLAGLIAAKRAARPAWIWNATFGGEELVGFLSPAPPAGPRRGTGLGPLRRIRGLLAAGIDDAGSARGLEAALVELARAEPLGPRLRDLDRLRHGLDAVATQLEAHRPATCGVVEVRIVRAFQRAYLAGVQPRAAALDRQVAPLLEVLAELSEALRAGLPLSEEVLGYLATVATPEGPHAVFAAYRAAMQRHATALAPTLRACGVLPEEAASPAPPSSGLRAPLS